MGFKTVCVHGHVYASGLSPIMSISLEMCTHQVASAAALLFVLVYLTVWCGIYPRYISLSSNLDPFIQCCPFCISSEDIYSSVRFLKPTFYCNAKPLALGRRVGLNPQRDHSALEIPTCWCPKSLADPTQSLTDPTQSLTDPMRPQREQVEYRSR